MAMKIEVNINGLHDKGKGGVKVGRKKACKLHPHFLTRNKLFHRQPAPQGLDR